MPNDNDASKANPKLVPDKEPETLIPPGTYPAMNQPQNGPGEHEPATALEPDGEHKMHPARPEKSEDLPEKH